MALQCKVGQQQVKDKLGHVKRNGPGKRKLSIDDIGRLGGHHKAAQVQVTMQQSLLLLAKQRLCMMV